MCAASEVLKNGGTLVSVLRLITVAGFIKVIDAMALPMAFLLNHVG
jgi:tRNA1(Val) A37 N6-methylase TrmN6